MGDLLDDYQLAEAYDEMFAGGRRAPGPLPVPERCACRRCRAATSRSAATPGTARSTTPGITFQLSGEERPFPLDLVPRILPADEWATIEAGVRQRVLALEAFLADVYGPGRILRDGVVPRRLVVTLDPLPPRRRRDRAAARRAGPRRRHRPRPRRRGPVPGARGQPAHAVGHLVRHREPAGDDPRVPRAVRQPPRAARSPTTRPRLLEALRATAPDGVDDPNVVVLTPGVHNAAYFEHSFLARQMGVELVEGRDLVCHDNIVSMRTTDGLQRVDVVYRRIDDDYLDPLHFRADSVLGCAGIVNAARAGHRHDRERGGQRRRRRQGDLPVRPGR